MAVGTKTGDWFWDSSAGPGTIDHAGGFLTIANLDSMGADFTSLLEGLVPGDVIHVDHVDDPNGWWVYSVSEVPTPGGGVPPVADHHLKVDNYSGGFVRAFPAPTAAGTVDFRLATSPGPGGALYPSVDMIPNNSAVWADFNGALGKVKLGTSDLLGNVLKRWINNGTVHDATIDSTDPGHPNLIIGAEIPVPPPAGATSIKVTAAGHGPTATPAAGDEMLVTFLLMVAPAEPPVPATPAAEAVAEYLGVAAVDRRMELCAAGAQRWVEARRSTTDPKILWADPAVVLGAVMYAALLYQQRAQPQGFAGMDALGTFSEDTGMAMAQIYRLVGADPVAV